MHCENSGGGSAAGAQEELPSRQGEDTLLTQARANVVHVSDPFVGAGGSSTGVHPVSIMLSEPIQSDCIPNSTPTPLSVLHAPGSGSSPATEAVIPPPSSHNAVLTVMIVGSPH